LQSFLACTVDNLIRWCFFDSVRCYWQTSTGSREGQLTVGWKLRGVYRFFTNTWCKW